MNKESLRHISWNRFKKNYASYIAVSIMCALFLILVCGLSFLDPFLTILAVPFFFFPLLFACHVSCCFLDANQRITAGAFSRYYLGFYRSQFRNSFKGLMSYLKTLAIYVVGIVITYFILYRVFAYNFGDLFNTSFEELIEVYSSNETTYEDVIAVLNDNNGLLLTFINYLISIPLLFAIPGFIYFISIPSLSIYYRVNIHEGAPSLIRIAINRTFARFGRKIKGDWFKLNWPLLVLSFLGGIGALLLDVLLFRNFALLLPIVIIGSVVLLVFYLPFYFANMEALYLKYEEGFKSGNQEAIEEVLHRIQNSIDLNEEEKRALENSFKDSHSDGQNE